MTGFSRSFSDAANFGLVIFPHGARPYPRVLVDDLLYFRRTFLTFERTKSVKVGPVALTMGAHLKLNRLRVCSGLSQIKAGTDFIKLNNIQVAIL
jgi:hypothetical protein